MMIKRFATANCSVKHFALHFADGLPSVGRVTGLRDKQEHRQRVRWGLTGLAFVFLFVLLGAAISRLGDRSAPVPGSPKAIDAARTKPEEPLAELGVAPSQAPDTNTPAKAAVVPVDAR